MTERGWLPPVAADELVAAATEDNDHRSPGRMRIRKNCQRAIATMADKEMLTPALLLRAACLGHMCVVEAGLAHLAGVSIVAGARHDVWPQRHAVACHSAARRPAGMPAHAILRAAMTVERQAVDEELEMDGEEFGRQLITTMMIEFHAMPDRERGRQLDHVARFAEEPVRLLARRVKADFAKVAA